MRFALLLFCIFIICANTAGCAKTAQPEDRGHYGLGAAWAGVHPMNVSVISADAAQGPDKPRSRDATLAYEHTVVVDTPESAVPSAVKRVSAACINDRANNCVVLATGISTGESGDGNVRLRIGPAGVETIIAAAVAAGTESSRQTTAEDLSDAIADTDTRMKMLTQYRERLLVLEAQSKSNVDALIKVTAELAKVQSDIERAIGETVTQKQRVSTEIVSIAFDPHRHLAFWRPISAALGSFTSSLSQGISSAIVGIAFLLPWLFVATPLGLLARTLWRRRSAR